VPLGIEIRKTFFERLRARWALFPGTQERRGASRLNGRVVTATPVSACGLTTFVKSHNA
jgi:hypothetical protein